MIETLVRATNLDLFRQNAEPFTQPMIRKHALIVGGIHLKTLQDLFPKYAVCASVIVPQTLPSIDLDYETEIAVKFEESNGALCKSMGLARDFSGFDSDCADIVIISTQIPSIREDFLKQLWRVTKEFGKIVVFSPTELPLSYLASFGIANPTHFLVEGFYAGTMRKVAAQIRHA